MILRAATQAHKIQTKPHFWDLEMSFFSRVEPAIFAFPAILNNGGSAPSRPSFLKVKLHEQPDRRQLRGNVFRRPPRRRRNRRERIPMACAKRRRAGRSARISDAAISVQENERHSEQPALRCCRTSSVSAGTCGPKHAKLWLGTFTGEQNTHQNQGEKPATVRNTEAFHSANLRSHAKAFVARRFKPGDEFVQQDGAPFDLTAR